MRSWSSVAPASMPASLFFLSVGIPSFRPCIDFAFVQHPKVSAGGGGTGNVGEVLRLSQRKRINSSVYLRLIEPAACAVLIGVAARVRTAILVIEDTRP